MIQLNSFTYFQSPEYKETVKDTQKVSFKSIINYDKFTRNTKI